MEKSVVAIAKGTDPEKNIVEVLDLLGGLKNLVRPGSTIVLKPNAGHNYPPETSVETSPEVVAAAIRVFRKTEPREIILAEAGGIGEDTMDCFRKSGILKAAEEAGVDRVVDIKTEKDLIDVKMRRARADIKSILLPRWLIEADHIVNLPIFKSHCCMMYTNALKNIKGLVQDKVHYEMHNTDLAAAMADIWSVVPFDISISDMMRPAEGFGPHYTFAAPMNCIVASKDPVALDAVACRMTGVDLNQIHYFASFQERGLGQYEEDRIEIRGRKIDDVYMPLWFPQLGGYEQYPEYNICAEGACSSCLSEITFTMEYLKALGEYDKNAGITIVAGKRKDVPEVDNPKNLILMGDCTKKFRAKGLWSSGCPPTEIGLLWPILHRRGATNMLELAGATTPEELQQFRKNYDVMGKKFEEYAAKERKKFLAKVGRKD